MLRFGNSSAFELIVKSQSIITSPLTVRFFSREGVSEYIHIPTSDGNITTTTHKITDVPIMISVVDDGDNYRQGACFVSLALAINGEIVYQLTSGFVYTLKALSWPPTSGQDALPGKGLFRTVTATDPGAGADVTLTVPNGHIFHPISGRIHILTSATVANRRIHIVFARSGGPSTYCFSDVDITANVDGNIPFAHYGDLPDRLDNFIYPINMPPNLFLTEDSTIGTEAVNLQGTDVLESMSVLVEDFFAAP